MIQAYVNNDHTEWDIHLQDLQFAINTCTHTSTKHTPAFLNLGRELNPTQCPRNQLENDDEIELQDIDRWTDHLRRLQTLRDEVQRHLIEANEKQAHYYNLRRRDIQFKEGDRVLKKNHTLSSGPERTAAKLSKKFIGPYIITKKISPTIYELTTESERQHGKHTTKNTGPDDTTTDETDDNNIQTQTRQKSAPPHTNHTPHIKQHHTKHNPQTHQTPTPTQTPPPPPQRQLYTSKQHTQPRHRHKRRTTTQTITPTPPHSPTRTNIHKHPNQPHTPHGTQYDSYDKKKKKKKDKTENTKYTDNTKPTDEQRQTEAKETEHNPKKREEKQPRATRNKEQRKNSPRPTPTRATEPKPKIEVQID
ncbi:proteoglycan 4-like [Neodiprion pinetum]|uniref:proteoglycan 4-like n=1 Tax=Neodiprion pinetum TaxID=441929 RepID=UPI00371ABB1F